MNQLEIITTRILPDIGRRVQDIIQADISEVTDAGGTEHNKFRFSSVDIAPAMRPRMFKTLHVNISGELASFEEKDVWCVRVGYRYTHFDGGSNGCSIAEMWYTPEGEFEATRSAFLIDQD